MTKKMKLKEGQKFKSYAAWDVNQEGSFDVLEIVKLEGKLTYFNHKKREFYALNFIGSENLVPIN